MRTTWTIAKKDFRAYFTSPIAYIVISCFLLIMGWMFFNIVAHFARESMQYQMYGKSLTLTDGVLRPLYGNLNVILLFLLPFVTMRLFAEEKKQHTIELLMTSPISTTEIVLGKFLSAVFLVLTLLAFTLVYPLTLVLTGNPELGTLFTSYLGTLLLACCYLSLGILFSAMTENQIVAGALTFAGGLFFWLVSWASQNAGPVWGDLFSYLSLIGHYSSFGVGTLNTSDITYYLSFIGMGLFLTHRVLESYRWRS